MIFAFIDKVILYITYISEMDSKKKLANAVGYRGKLEKFGVEKAKAILATKKANPKSKAKISSEESTSKPA